MQPYVQLNDAGSHIADLERYTFVRNSVDSTMVGIYLSREGVQMTQPVSYTIGSTPTNFRTLAGGNYPEGAAAFLATSLSQIILVSLGSNVDGTIAIAPVAGCVVINAGVNIPFGRVATQFITQGSVGTSVSITNFPASNVATSTVAVAAAAVAGAVKASAGRLVSVLITTGGATAVTFYDNASAGSGTIIGYIPAGLLAGTLLVFNMPAAAGIWGTNGAGAPAYTAGIV